MEHMQKVTFFKIQLIWEQNFRDNTLHILSIKAIYLQLLVLSCNRVLWDNIQTNEGKRNKKVSSVYVSI